MRLIELDQRMEKVLTDICDLALKGAGLAAHSLVASLIAGIKSIEDKPVPKEPQE